LKEANQKSLNTLFPVFLKAEELKILLVGAGPVGIEKATAILSNAPNCRLTVVAELILEEMWQLKEAYPQINIAQRRFKEEDLNAAEMLFLAINNIDLSRKIKDLANSKKILVNVADTPDLCDFYLSSIVTKGDLKIAISTNGKSPTMAKRLKEMLFDIIPDDFQSLLSNMQLIRSKLKGDFSYKVTRLNEITADILKGDEKK
jgi:siroheme synthase-like protein